MPFFDAGWEWKLHVDDYCHEFREGFHGPRPHFDYLTHRCRTVDLWALRNAVHDIPVQSNSWSCGPTAAGQALTITGTPPNDYQDLHNNAKCHALGHIECGPGPGQLYHMICKKANYHDVPHGFGYGLNITNELEPQEHWLNESLQRNRPMLVLFEVANRGLHWAVVVGHETADNGRLLLLNSDGCICLMHRDELWRRMDLKDHIINNLPFPIISDQFGRFNSISCTYGELPADTAGDHRRNWGNRHAQLRGNHSYAYNIVDTILNNSILGWTPIGLGWRAVRGLGNKA